MFSSFVSGLTSSMGLLQMLRNERSRDQANLWKYLAENQVSMDLGVRVNRYFRARYEARKVHVHEVDMKFFTDMPMSLQLELHREVYMPTLVQHPLFLRCSLMDRDLMIQVCH